MNSKTRGTQSAKQSPPRSRVDENGRLPLAFVFGRGCDLRQCRNDHCQNQ